MHSFVSQNGLRQGLQKEGWESTIWLSFNGRHLCIKFTADINKTIANDYGVLLPAGIALRGLFVIDPDGVLQYQVVNFLNFGRSTEETLRVIQATQTVKTTGEVCPANWKPGDKTMKPDPVKSKEYFSSRN